MQQQLTQAFLARTGLFGIMKYTLDISEYDIGN